MEFSRDALILHLLRTDEGVVSRASGDCMRPVFEDGDQLEVKSARVCAARPGDVVLFELGGRLKLHRLERLARGRAYTRPEHGPFDAPVDAQSVVGVLIAVNGRPIRRATRLARASARARRWLGRWAAA